MIALALVVIALLLAMDSERRARRAERDCDRWRVMADRWRQNADESFALAEEWRAELIAANRERDELLRRIIAEHTQ